MQRVAARHLFAELEESAWCDPASDADGLKHLLGVLRWRRHADSELASGRERGDSRGGVEAADLVTIISGYIVVRAMVRGTGAAEMRTLADDLPCGG